MNKKRKNTNRLARTLPSGIDGQTITIWNNACNADSRLKTLVNHAGITKHVTFHVARHTFATLTLQYGADLYTASKLLGHSNIRTTQIYAKIVDESKRKAVNLIPNLQHLREIKTNPFRFYSKYLFVCLLVHTFANQIKTMGADNKATLEEIEAFLNEFKEKSKVFGIKYDIDKEENFRTLLDLEMPGARRDEYIYNLKPEDYYQGPGINDYDPKEGMVWMFGIGIKKRGKKKKIPIYIKIYITKVNGAPNFCISFHEAKFDMVFPYKQEL